MPIELQCALRNLTSAEFDEVDRVVMPMAYAAQNALGRLWDEPVYEEMLAGLLRETGVREVMTQVPVFVRHDGFEKMYRLDLVAGHAVYELKVVQEFAPQHDAQAYHYAMLAEVNHVKLLNFRSPGVRGRLRFNAVLGCERRRPQWHEAGWRPVTPRCSLVRQRLRDLVADWGTHLDYHLYEEALVGFCGGEAVCAQRVSVRHAGRELGSHRVLSHAEGLAFLVSGYPDPRAQLGHVQRLCELTRRRAVQWMNLNKRDIHLVTVE